MDGSWTEPVAYKGGGPAVLLHTPGRRVRRRRPTVQEPEIMSYFLGRTEGEPHPLSLLGDRPAGCQSYPRVIVLLALDLHMLASTSPRQYCLLVVPRGGLTKTRWACGNCEPPLYISGERAYRSLGVPCVHRSPQQQRQFFPLFLKRITFAMHDLTTEHKMHEEKPCVHSMPRCKQRI